MVEQLTHVLDLARVLLGEAEAVYAVGVLDGTEPPQGSEADDIDDGHRGHRAIRLWRRRHASRRPRCSAPSERAGLDIIGRGRTLELSEAALIVDDGATRVEHTAGRRRQDRSSTREFIAAVRGRARAHPRAVRRGAGHPPPARARCTDVGRHRSADPDRLVKRHNLVILEPGRVELVEETLPELPDGGLLLRTVATGLSAGTELTFVKGDNPGLHARLDAELGLFVPTDAG
ncbi:MAG: hypothetical protein WKF83_09980 [Nocardioidaceae bacterium]